MSPRLDSLRDWSLSVGLLYILIFRRPSRALVWSAPTGETLPLFSWAIWKWMRTKRVTTLVSSPTGRSGLALVRMHADFPASSILYCEQLIFLFSRASRDSVVFGCEQVVGGSNRVYRKLHRVVCCSVRCGREGQAQPRSGRSVCVLRSAGKNTFNCRNIMQTYIFFKIYIHLLIHFHK